LIDAIELPDAFLDFAFEFCSGLPDAGQGSQLNREDAAAILFVFASGLRLGCLSGSTVRQFV
jgi:hypothetical protein